jgi:hypothetical protein
VQSLRHLRRKPTALFLFRTRGKPRPVRKKTWAAAPAPTSHACQNALRTKKPLRRQHSAGGLVCPDSGVTWPYLPHPIANTPVGHWWAMAATAGRPGAWGPPDPGSDPDPKPPAPWPFLLVQQVAASWAALGLGLGGPGPRALLQPTGPKNQEANLGLGAWAWGLGGLSSKLQATSETRDD